MGNGNALLKLIKLLLVMLITTPLSVPPSLYASHNKLASSSKVSGKDAKILPVFAEACKVRVETGYGPGRLGRLLDKVKGRVERTARPVARALDRMSKRRLAKEILERKLLEMRNAQASFVDFYGHRNTYRQELFLKCLYDWVAYESVTRENIEAIVDQHLLMAKSCESAVDEKITECFNTSGMWLGKRAVTPENAAEVINNAVRIVQKCGLLVAPRGELDSTHYRISYAIKCLRPAGEFLNRRALIGARTAKIDAIYDGLIANVIPIPYSVTSDDRGLLGAFIIGQFGDLLETRTFVAADITRIRNLIPRLSSMITVTIYSCASRLSFSADNKWGANAHPIISNVVDSAKTFLDTEAISRTNSSEVDSVIDFIPRIFSVAYFGYESTADVSSFIDRIILALLKAGDAGEDGFVEIVLARKKILDRMWRTRKKPDAMLACLEDLDTRVAVLLRGNVPFSTSVGELYRSLSSIYCGFIGVEENIEDYRVELDMIISTITGLNIPDAIKVLSSIEGIVGLFCENHANDKAIREILLGLIGDMKESRNVTSTAVAANQLATRCFSGNSSELEGDSGTLDNFRKVLRVYVVPMKVSGVDNYGIPMLDAVRADFGTSPLALQRCGETVKEVDLETKVRAILLNNAQNILVYTTEKVRGYAESGVSVDGEEIFVRGLREHKEVRALGIELHSRGFSLLGLLQTLRLDNDASVREELVRILCNLGYGVDEKGNIILKTMDVVTSVYRGSKEVDHAMARFSTHSPRHALCTYANLGAGCVTTEDPDLAVSGNKSLHEVDYALMCYESVSNRHVDSSVALAFYFGETGSASGAASDLPKYCYKRTIVAEGKSGLEVFEDIIDKQKKERIAEEVIQRILSWVESGDITGEALQANLELMRKMIEILREVYGWEYWTAMFGYMDEQFYSAIIRDYKAGQPHNMGLLVRELNLARDRQLRYLRRTLSDDYRHRLFLEHLNKQKALWEKEGKNILDYLRFKQKIREQTYASDAHRPDITSEVERIMGTVTTIEEVSRVPTYREYSFGIYKNWIQGGLREDAKLQGVIATIPQKPNAAELRKFRPLREWFLRAPSSMHGIAHESRVLILAEVLMNILGNISPQDKNAVRLSAATHDVRRMDDTPSDTRHGPMSADWIRVISNIFREIFPDINMETVAGLNRSHHSEENPDNILLSIFMDADGLDWAGKAGHWNGRCRCEGTLELVQIAKYLYEISTELIVRFGVSDFEAVILAGRIIGIIEGEGDITLPDDITAIALSRIPAPVRHGHLAETGICI